MNVQYMASDENIHAIIARIKANNRKTVQKNDVRKGSCLNLKEVKIDENKREKIER